MLPVLGRYLCIQPYRIRPIQKQRKKINQIWDRNRGMNEIREYNDFCVSMQCLFGLFFLFI